MSESKTTLVRKRKIDGILDIIDSLNYFIAHFHKSNLWLVKTSDLKKVSLIATSWKEGLMDLSKESQNSNTGANDGHARRR